MAKRGVWLGLTAAALFARVAAGAVAAPLDPMPAAPIVFTPLDERSVTFTADGRTAYFPIRVGDGYMQVLCESTLENGHWSEPRVLPFSGGAAVDADPFVTPDGRHLYFATSRALDGSVKRDLDIWVVTREATGWGMPRPIVGKINTDQTERSPVLVPSGRLYFASTRAGGGDLFVAKSEADGFGEPQSLGEGVNSPAYEATLAVSPDEKTLVFAAIGRSDETLSPGVPYPRGDLYVSRWDGAKWSVAKRLPAPINSNASEGSAAFSHDGKTLFFMSERGFATNQDITLDYPTLQRGLASALNGRGNIYAVDARALDVDVK